MVLLCLKVRWNDPSFWFFSYSPNRPKVNVAIVDPETCILCPPDAIGEIWLDAPSISGGFWALPKHTEAIFHARPIVIPTETLRPEIYNQEFLRTGLVGTLIGGRLVIFGSYEDRIRQQRLGESFGIEEVHFADHLLATIQKHARIEQWYVNMFTYCMYPS